MWRYGQVVFLLSIFCYSECFREVPKSVRDELKTDSSLSEKELKIIRFLSYLTFLQNNGTWYGWEKNYDGPQLDLDSIRYPLAHIGYTAAALAYRTPNYRELSIQILNDTIERMLNIKVWGYIDHYWRKNSNFPDPVSYENIMYSGHLLQLISLFESISGDFTYDMQGFDFIWNKSGDPITTIHYTTTKLAEAIYRQMDRESSAGVSCEPGWVYTICQNHPHLGFRLYDTIRDEKTNFTIMSSKWKKFLIEHALEDIPLYKRNRYFKMLFQRETHVWVPFFASTGNDGWALAWLSSWFDQSETSNFVCDGWQIMLNNQYWKLSANHSAPGCFLDSGGYIGVRMQLNSWVATSFYPMVEKQCSLRPTDKLNCTYDWFENNFGTLMDTDQDGYFESYYYETSTIYSNWITANLLLSFVMDDRSYSSKDFLRNIYQTKFYSRFIEEPEILAVQYPMVRVIQTKYTAANKSLIVIFNTEKPSVLSTTFDVKYPSSKLTLKIIMRDGNADTFTYQNVTEGRIRVQYTYARLDLQETDFYFSFE